MLFAILNTIILGILASVHFYWLVGGRWGIDSAIPVNKDGAPIFKPRMIETLIVSLGLLAMAILHLYKAGFVNMFLPDFIDKYVLKIIAAIFLIRAIGDFRYIGFFKKAQDTKFGIADTRFFSPLCLLLSMNALLTDILL